jgi:hypothetical protein
MIHYQLRCTRDHEFDGWFKDSVAFERQVELGLVECPDCGDVKVSRAMMAPAISTRRATAPTPAPAQPPSDAPPPGAVAVKLPDHVRAALQRLRSEVERNCHYVGDRFAEEARRIHQGESEARGIYGETTPDQAEALAEDGISFSRIPWLPRAES